MAYMDQKRKTELAPKVKEILKKYGIKGSLSVINHSTLRLKIKSGPIDFITNYNETVSARPGGFQLGSPATTYLSVNVYWYKEHFSGEAFECLDEVIKAMNVGNWDKSDAQSDYFNVGWYIDVEIGNWKQPYICE